MKDVEIAHDKNKVINFLKHDKIVQSSLDWFANGTLEEYLERQKNRRKEKVGFIQVARIEDMAFWLQEAREHYSISMSFGCKRGF